MKLACCLGADVGRSDFEPSSSRQLSGRAALSCLASAPNVCARHWRYCCPFSRASRCPPMASRGRVAAIHDPADQVARHLSIAVGADTVRRPQVAATAGRVHHRSGCPPGLCRSHRAIAAFPRAAPVPLSTAIERDQMASGLRATGWRIRPCHRCNTSHRPAGPEPLPRRTGPPGSMVGDGLRPPRAILAPTAASASGMVFSSEPC
jgi:hypothetical protein